MVEDFVIRTESTKIQTQKKLITIMTFVSIFFFIVGVVFMLVKPLDDAFLNKVLGGVFMLLGIMELAMTRIYLPKAFAKKDIRGKI